LGDSEWHDLINAQTQSADPKHVSNYIDYSMVGSDFKLSEAAKNVHELDPTSIPKALKQMAHYHILIPLLMFTTQSLKISHDNIGDLYMKKKTRLSATKYILNSN